MTSDPIILQGGVNTYGYAYANGLMFNDPYGFFVPPSLSQGFVDASAGFDDGIIYGISFGLLSEGGQSIRELMNTDGVVNRCSNNYYNFHKGGQVAGMVAGTIGIGRLGMKGIDARYNGYGIRNQLHRFGSGPGLMIFRIKNFRLQTQANWGGQSRGFYQHFYAKIHGKKINIIRGNFQRVIR